MQGFHKRQLQEQINLLQHHNDDCEELTSEVLEAECRVLQQAADAAVSQDMQRFTTHCIPEMERMLSAKQTLASCWEVLPADE